MFRERQLDKLVKAGIISEAQKGDILEFDGNAGSGFVSKMLSLLGVFIVGVGIISLIASNWDAISDNMKLFSMFAMLFGAAGAVIYYREKGEIEVSEKWLVALFFLVGGAIGLIIQVYHLSGGRFYMPFGRWWQLTLPLVLIAQRKYVAYFWVPLFLGWVLCYVELFDGQFNHYWGETLLLAYAVLALLGRGLKRFFPRVILGVVLEKGAVSAFNLVLFFTILLSPFGRFAVMHLGISLAVLAVLFAGCSYFHSLKGIRRIVKFAGLWVFSLYIYLGDKVGLFSTGIGMIISGLFLLAVLKVVSKTTLQVKEEKKDV